MDQVRPLAMRATNPPRLTVYLNTRAARPFLGNLGCFDCRTLCLFPMFSQGPSYEKQPLPSGILQKRTNAEGSCVQ